MSNGDAVTQVRNGFLTAAGAAVFGVVALWLLRRSAAGAGGIDAAGAGSSTGLAAQGGADMAPQGDAASGLMAAPAGATVTMTADQLGLTGDCLCGGNCGGSTSRRSSGGGEYIGRPVPHDETIFGGPVGSGVPFFSAVM